MYAKGEGVRQNLNESAAWFLKAANQGEAVAQSALGYMYVTGEGVLQDFKEAAGWYRKAAEQGDSSAQHNLAHMYATGGGVSKNLVIAYMLYNLAATRGNERSAEKRLEIAKMLTKPQMEEGQALSRNWSVGQPLPTMTKTY